MIRSAVTVSLVPEARGGPFVFWDDLSAACARAAELGFDAVEIFAPSAGAVDGDQLTRTLEQHELRVAAVGTGAGMLKHGLSLTDADPQKRDSARDYIRQMIDFGGRFKAPAIIGSMQGKWGADVGHDAALELLRDALNDLGPHALTHDVPLIYEPLNRYETNLITTMEEGVAFLKTLSNDNVRLLADLFHMNIEETSLPDAIRAARGAMGHVHFVDSNRKAAGLGHTDFGPIAKALKEIEFDGYASAEALPLPDSDTAAAQTIEAFNTHFR